MFIYSGKVNLGRCGEETHLRDCNDEPLYVGDIVITYVEGDIYAGSLTAVVKDEDGFFVMGIKVTDFMDEDSEWKVRKLKGWKQVIDGEKWEKFGFNYKLEAK